jgi:hypothetical protein
MKINALLSWKLYWRAWNGINYHSVEVILEGKLGEDFNIYHSRLTKWKLYWSHKCAVFELAEVILEG